MKRVLFDPQPDEALDHLWEHNERLADRVEEAVDWIRDGDARAKRRGFSDGIYLIEVHFAHEAWSVLWEEPPGGTAYVRHIAESTSDAPPSDDVPATCQSLAPRHAARR